MNQKLMWTIGTGSALLAAGVGFAIVMAEPTEGPVAGFVMKWRGFDVNGH
jgi:hypothetical protein